MKTCYLGEIGIFPFDSFLQEPVTAALTKYALKQKPAPKGNANTPTDPLLLYVFGKAKQVHDLLLQAGIPEPAASYGTYATYHETQAYSNAGAKLYNNYSGIKFAGQKGAKKGPNNYAVFTTNKDWANAYKHELTKGSNPAGAGTLEDFAARLKQNGYYEDSQDNYTHGLTRARLVLKVLPAADRASVQPDGTVQDTQDLDIPGSKDYSKKDSGAEAWWNSLPWYGKTGIGIGAGLVLFAAVKR